MPKFNEIGPNEAAKMIVRGVLFIAPLAIREKYRDFVKPFTLSDETDPLNENQVSEEENAMLERFVADLSCIATVNGDDRKILEQQRNDVISVAEHYLEMELFKVYKDPLETITANVRSRKIVSYNYEESAYKETSSKADDSIPYSPEFFAKAAAFKAEISNKIAAETERLDKIENIDDYKMSDDESLESFLDTPVEHSKTSPNF